MAEATQRGLAPSQVLAVIPLLIPNTLPYTIPATTLFATCVVYGRLSHDNEIVAAQGGRRPPGPRGRAERAPRPAHARPARMGLYYDFIPKHAPDAADAGDRRRGGTLVRGAEAPGVDQAPKDLPFAIWVRQVQGRRLFDVIFKDTDKEKGGYRGVVRAREATIHYDAATNAIRIDMSYCSAYGDAVRSTAQSPSRYAIPAADEVLGTDYVRTAERLRSWEIDRPTGDDPGERCDGAYARHADATAGARLHTCPRRRSPTELNTASEYLSVQEAGGSTRSRSSCKCGRRWRWAAWCFVLLGGAGRHLVQQGRLPERVRQLLPADGCRLLPAPACAAPTWRRRAASPPAVGLWAANAVVGVGRGRACTGGYSRSRTGGCRVLRAA